MLAYAVTAILRLNPGRSFLPWLSCVLSLLTFFSVGEAIAGWAGRFSLTASEEYNDNIFFNSVNKESDFITSAVPTFTALYSPPGQVVPTFVANVSPFAQFYARNSDLNNFGDNIVANATWNYQYSRRLLFTVADAMARGGSTRTGLGAEGLSESTTPTSFSPPGSTPSLSEEQDLDGLLNRGKSFQNNFSVDGAYLLRPRLTVLGRYRLTYKDFDSVNDSEISNSVGVRGVYAWNNHNLHAGYTVTFLSRTGGSSSKSDSVIHSFDFGDDFFSAFQIRLTPTLTLSLSSGLALNTGGDGPKIVNNSSATLVKVWQTAVFRAGTRTGLGSSFGLSSGVAQRTTFFSGFDIRLTQNLKGLVLIDYNMINGEDNDTNIFRASSSLQYWITTWLSSNLSYTHRWRTADNSTESISRGRASGNSVMLALTAHFDVWPYVGLSRAPMQEFLFQPALPPFAAPPAAESGPAEPAQPLPPAPPS